MSERRIYLDNNATSAVSPAALEAMMPFFTKFYGNPSSMHLFATEVVHHFARARQQVASLLNASESEIIFTSSGTEANNHAIRGVLDANPDKKHIITTKVEHPAVLNLSRYLTKNGYRLTELEVNQKGDLDLDQLQSAITSDTAIVSIMAANNETGNTFPLDKIAQIVKEKGVYLHTDAVQAVGKVPIDLKNLPVDLLSLSGHKLHAPKGIGALYIRNKTRVSPLMYGGHQEYGRRPGTENVAFAVALGTACDEAQKDLSQENDKMRVLRDKLESALIKIPNTHINGNPTCRLPNTTNIGFEYIEGEAILLHLSAAGIAASTGSACASDSLEPSHVLMAMKTPFTYAHGSIRFSLSKYTTEEEIDYAIETIPPIIDNLRKMSPYYEEN